MFVNHRGAWRHQKKGSLVEDGAKRGWVRRGKVGGGGRYGGLYEGYVSRSMEERRG
jgi:hypothetical protein